MTIVRINFINYLPANKPKCPGTLISSSGKTIVAPTNYLDLYLLGEILFLWDFPGYRSLMTIRINFGLFQLEWRSPGMGFFVKRDKK